MKYYIVATIERVNKWVTKNWMMFTLEAFAVYGLISFLTDIGINELYPHP